MVKQIDRWIETSALPVRRKKAKAKANRAKRNEARSKRAKPSTTTHVHLTLFLRCQRRADTFPQKK